MALASLLEQGSYLEASLLVKATIRLLLPREDGEPLAPALDDFDAAPWVAGKRVAGHVLLCLAAALLPACIAVEQADMQNNLHA